MIVNSQTTIEVRGLTKIYSGQPAVDEISFNVRGGEIFGIVGPDDSGKTTLLRMIAGIISPGAGQISILGSDVSQSPEKVRSEIGYLAQVFSLYSDLTISENLDFFGKSFSVPEPVLIQRKKELLRFSNLTPFKKRLAGNLSGGMKKKLTVICALLHRPKILIMDEPTIGVDPVTRRELWRMFYSMKREGITILVSTSYMDEAELCTRIGYMYEGNFINVDTPRRIKDHFDMKVLRISGTPRPRMKEVLSDIPGKPYWAPFGINFHVYDRTGKLTPDFLKGLFRNAGCDGVNVSNVPVSLEDVFIKRLNDIQGEMAGNG